MKCRGTFAVPLAVLAVGIAVGAGASSGAAAARAGCPGQTDASAPAAAQERTMLCLVNRAREQRGLAPLAAPPLAGPRRRPQVGRLEGNGGVHVWTQQFGSPCR